MTGVVIAQVMRLYRSLDPDPILGFFVVSVPLSLVCHVMAMICTIFGCYRFLHWQNEMARGNAISSGWELNVVFMLSLLVCPVYARWCRFQLTWSQVLVCIFTLVLTISIRRDEE